MYGFPKNISDLTYNACNTGKISKDFSWLSEQQIWLSEKNNKTTKNDQYVHSRRNMYCTVGRVNLEQHTWGQ